jgi:hypothetical protein
VETTVVRGGGNTLVQGEGKSQFQWRVGVHCRPDSKTNVGAVYAWERDRSEVTLSRPLPRPRNRSGEYRNTVLMVGGNREVSKGTILFGNWQIYRLKGPGINDRIDIFFYGVMQYFKENNYTSVTIGSLQNGLFISGNYNRKKLNVGFSYSPRASRRLEEFLSRGKGGFLWASLDF